MKMLTTTRQKSLSLSGGHIVSDETDLLMPSYSPNAVTPSVTGQHFPWEEDVNEINTPDIDPSFFDSDPFKLKMKAAIEPMAQPVADETSYLMADANTLMTIASDDSSHTQSYEDMNLSQMLSQTNVDINSLINGETDAVMAAVGNDMLDTQYTPVLHYLEPKQSTPIDAIAMNVITTNPQIMDTTSTVCFTSPAHSSSQSYSPALSTINYSHLSPSPSPALSYTSTVISSPSTIISMDSMPSEGSSGATTLEGLIVDTIDQKPDLDFLQSSVPTVVTDHLYTISEASGTRKRRKSSADSKDKYLSSRKRNNTSSKKSRVTKKDKQKQMDEQIQYYLEDNETCRKRIEQMEREIEWCKNYLFKKVVASARS